MMLLDLLEDTWLEVKSKNPKANEIRLELVPEWLIDSSQTGVELLFFFIKDSNGIEIFNFDEDTYYNDDKMLNATSLMSYNLMTDLDENSEIIFELEADFFDTNDNYELFITDDFMKKINAAILFEKLNDREIKVPKSANRFNKL